MKMKLQNIIFDNFSYKIVALFIALVLWVTILGRRDFIISRNLDIEFHVKPGVTVASQSVEQVKVILSGPRASLRRFVDSGSSQIILLDVSDLHEGSHEVEIPLRKIDVPFGVKIQSIKPTTVKVQLKDEG